MTIAAIDVRDLLGHPGASRRVELDGDVDVDGFELASLAGPVHGDLLMESVVEGILVSGTLTGAMRLRCARCLRELERPLEIEVQELVAAEPGEDDDAYPLSDGSFEPEAMVRDAVGVEMPFAPLCRPGCLGLCSVCGEDRNLGRCPGHREVDPRWEALEGLLVDQTADDR